LPKSILNREEQEKFVERLSKREEVAVDDCHFLATILHPYYGRKYFSPEALSAMEVLERD
jgi:hypothetical protein